MDDYERTPVPLPAGMMPARLLFVDGDIRTRSSVAKALSRMGCLVDEVGSARRALEVMREGSYDLLLLDTHLPDMDGKQVLRHVRQLQPDIVIIILTSRPVLESAIAAVKAEAFDYLLKPVPLGQIMEVVVRALHRRADQLQRRRLMRAIGEALDALRRAEELPSPSLLQGAASAGLIQAGPLTLDRHRRSLLIQTDKQVVLQLTESETVVLASLMAQPDQVLACRELARVAMGVDLPEDQAQNLIRPHIFRLRKKTEKVLKAPIIYTLRRRGYYFSLKGLR